MASMKTKFTHTLFSSKCNLCCQTVCLIKTQVEEQNFYWEQYLCTRKCKRIQWFSFIGQYFMYGMFVWIFMKQVTTLISTYFIFTTIHTSVGVAIILLLHPVLIVSAIFSTCSVLYSLIIYSWSFKFFFM